MVLQNSVFELQIIKHDFKFYDTVIEIPKKFEEKNIQINS